jgi:tRNA pseudouridine38-40 synthase
MIPLEAAALYQQWVSLIHTFKDVEFRAYEDALPKFDAPMELLLNAPFKTILAFKEFSFDGFIMDDVITVRFRQKSLTKLQIDWSNTISSRYLIDFGYNGTLFQGMQRQKSPLRTVQSEIEKVLSHIYQAPIEISPASRTDRGVHAEHNFAHFDVPSHSTLKDPLKLIQKMIPDDLIIHQLIPVSSVFHARYDALSKTYQYRLRSNKRLHDLHTAWVVPELNGDEIRGKMDIFVGVHDFKNFSKYRDAAGTLRSIDYIHLTQEEKTLVLEIKGQSFMRYMIRMMVGALIKYDKKTIDEGLKNPDISLGKHIAPSHGLTLTHIDY